jgi:hypothetical protein
MNREEIEAQVLKDYARFEDELVVVPYLVYFQNDTSYDMRGPFMVRVLKGQKPYDIIVWNDDYCDPVWYVEPVDEPEIPKDATSFWAHGISYQLGAGETKDRHPRLAASFAAQQPTLEMI